MTTPVAFTIGALVVAALVAISSAGSQDQDSQASLRVLSANIRFGLADDGAHSWKNRAALTVETLKGAEPDVLGLQEALDFQVEAIREAFPHFALIGEGRELKGEGEWCAILVDSQRFSIRASGTFRLSPKNEVGAMGWDAACTRIATWAKLVDRQVPDAPFLVLNTHFDHVGKEARAKSAELLVGWGKRQQATHGQMPVVLMGDLNAGEDSPPLRTLKDAGLQDTFRASHPEAEETGTFHGFQGGRDGRRIDFVLATKHWRVDDAWIDWMEKEGQYPSDHRFVGATLSRGR